jgi:P4 family phage/plasmid primase-like protien
MTAEVLAVRAQEVPQLEPVQVDTHTFVTALTGKRYPVVTLQTFDDSPLKRRGLARVLHGTVEEHWRELVRLNRAGAGIFVMVNEGDGQGRAAANARALRALFVDDDSGALTPSALGLAPSVVVQSKNGLHVYWRLRPGEALSTFTQAQEALAAALGTDPAVKDLPRVMRVPGFIHAKDPADPFLVRLVQVCDISYTVAEVLEGNGATLTAPEPPRPTPAPRSTFAGHTGEAFKRAQAAMLQRDQAEQGGRNDAAYQTACYLGDFALSELEAWDLLCEWNKGNAPPLGESELRSALDHASKYRRQPEGLKLAEDSVFRPFLNGGALKQEDAAVDEADEQATFSTGGNAIAVEEGEDAEDLRNARRLTERARGRFLAVHRIGGGFTWYGWDGRRWARDGVGAIYELASKVAKSWLKDAAEAKSEKKQKGLIKHGLKSQQAQRLDAMVRLAGLALPDLKATAEQLDAEPWSLNVENGTINLKTGGLRPHDPADLISKLSPVVYDPAATAPRFGRFLAEVLPSSEVRAYIQRAAGYSLTGITREHCLFLLIGAGRNGKGVLMRLLLRTLGSYAMTAPEGLLIQKSGMEHPTELAGLEGARFVFISELPPRSRWDESRLKGITGGDPQRARFMRQDFFEFQPACKLWVAGNERPRVNGTSDAIWERLKEVRFPVQFRDEDDPLPERQRWPVKDPKLEEEHFPGELSGILTWAVKGCLEWQRRGLGEPPEVRTATAEYRAVEDRLAPFLADHPIKKKVRLRNLFADWVKHCEEVNEQPGKQPDLNEALTNRGYSVRKSEGVYQVFPHEVPLQRAENAQLAPSVQGAVDQTIPDSHHDSLRARGWGSIPEIAPRQSTGLRDGGDGA